MKKVQNVMGFEKALVFKNNKLIRVLSEGMHWIDWFTKIELVSLKNPYFTHTDFTLLIENPILKEYLNIYIIEEGHIAIETYKNRLINVYTSGVLATWKEVANTEIRIVDTNLLFIDKSISVSFLENEKLKNYVRKIEVSEVEAVMLFIDFKPIEMLKAGVYNFWKNSQAVHVSRCDKRLQLLEISGQEFLTKDKVNIRININAAYKIKDFAIVLTEIKDYEKQLYSTIQLAARELVSTHTIDELLQLKHSLGNVLMLMASKFIEQIGLELYAIGFKDIILPGDIKDIMNRVLVAEKQAHANIIERREETAATRSLLNTAKLLEENPTLWKLKEMEYIEKIADKIDRISVSGKSNIVSQLKDIFVQ